MTDDEFTRKDLIMLSRYVKIIAWVTAVLFALAFIGLLRSISFANSVDKVNVQTNELAVQTQETKLAAVEARDALLKAIAKGEENASSPEAVKEALRAIARIEIHLCGGPCDVEIEEHQNG